MDNKFSWLQDKLLIGAVFVFLVTALMVFYAFDIHHALPMGFQWTYSVLLVVLFIIFCRGLWISFHRSIRNELLQRTLPFLTIFISLGVLYQISSIKREAEVRSFF